MNHFGYFLEDPVVQLVLLVTIAVCIYDSFKFVLEKLASWLGFNDKEE